MSSHLVIGVALSGSVKFLRIQHDLADRGLRGLFALQKEVHTMVSLILLGDGT